MIAFGTIVPFFLLVSALRHLSASRVAIVAMLEPVAGALVAWAWLSESLDRLQLTGAAVVLAAIGLAQTAR
jgi:drug/metabolite transporter (DMT)-like permease